VGQQVADRELARHVRVVEPEVRQVVDDLVIPVDLALVDEQREGRRRERLRVRRDAKEGIGVDLAGLAQFAHAVAAGKDDLAVLDDAHRHAGHVVGCHRAGHERVEIDRLERIAGRRRRQRQGERKTAAGQQRTNGSGQH
jgi:hypothetical protein